MINSQAIGTHAAWKRRLKAIITEGRSDVLPERVAPDNHVAAAEKSMGLAGAYSNVSADLTAAMMDWKKALGS